jgi:hypothetical protein
VYHPAAAALLKIDRHRAENRAENPVENPTASQGRLPEDVRHSADFGVLTPCNTGSAQR